MAESVGRRKRIGILHRLIRLGKPLGKDLGKVFACNSRDFLNVRYEIRQTYAACLILPFMRRVTLRYTPWRIYLLELFRTICVERLRTPPHLSSGVLIRMSQSMTNTLPLSERITFSSCISLR